MGIGKTTEELQFELREKISGVLVDATFTGSLDRMQMAESLIQSAFTLCDFGDGINDTQHAAKRLHELVDKTGAATNSGYKAS